MTYQRIVLASRPKGIIKPENFRLETVDLQAELCPGEVLVENHYLSLDPYMRGRMSLAKSYAEPQAVDATMIGTTAGIVVESRHPDFKMGSYVVGGLGWSEMRVANANMLRKVDPTHIPLSAFLGVVGMPGVTAWYGVNTLLQATAGRTLVVSAASGAVGSAVGQLAKLKGCRVVGIAGGEKKCRHVVEELGFDACVDYKNDLVGGLAAATPDGIDLLFENVGGSVFDASLARLNPFSKIVLCGMISGYNGVLQPVANIGKVLTMRASLQGFIITEHMEVWPQALQELAELVVSGKLMYRETIAHGLTAAPEALIGLLNGENLGKQLVRLK